MLLYKADKIAANRDVNEALGPNSYCKPEWPYDVRRLGSHRSADLSGPEANRAQCVNPKRMPADAKEDYLGHFGDSSVYFVKAKLQSRKATG